MDLLFGSKEGKHAGDACLKTMCLCRKEKSCGIKSRSHVPAHWLGKGGVSGHPEEKNESKRKHGVIVGQSRIKKKKRLFSCLQLVPVMFIRPFCLEGRVNLHHTFSFSVKKEERNHCHQLPWQPRTPDNPWKEGGKKNPKQNMARAAVSHTHGSTVSHGLRAEANLCLQHRGVHKQTCTETIYPLHCEKSLPSISDGTSCVAVNRQKIQ